MAVVNISRISGPDGRGSLPVRTYLSYEVLSDMATIADAFQIKLPGPHAGEEKPLQSGDTVEFRIGSKVLFRGIVDATWVSIDEDGTTTSIVGRDLGRDLVDWAMPLVHYDAAGLLVVAKEAIKDTAITEVLSQSVPFTGYSPKGTFMGEPETLPELDSTALRVHTNPGESRSQFLARYVAQMDHLAWVNTLGQLVIGLPSVTEPVGTIRVQQGISNAKIMIREAPAMAFTSVTILTTPELDLQAGESDDELPLEAYVARSIDPRLEGFNRERFIPKANKISMVEGMIEAERELSRSAQEILQVEVTVPDHIHDGWFLRPDQTWRIYAPDHGLDKSLYLRSARYEQTEDQRATTRCLFVEHGTVVSGFVGRDPDPNDNLISGGDF